ncbi:homoserine dehydrogenase [Desulfococcus sp.]|uniref:homoserine dehydrogenase n=1 Tax=Desulfococcus sp. TaxID=2025834 RepID=UPI0035938C10
MRQVNVGVLGFGTVGTGVVRILLENKTILRARVGVDLNLKYVADIDTQTNRGIALEPGVLVNDAFRVVNDPDVDIVVEMIGGEGIAKELILKAIENGKHVVTANKALIAGHGNTIARAAAEKGVDFGYEASVGGCMPVIKSVRESLVGNRIHAMIGILNGTCNYILTRITEAGSSFSEALAEAQAEGFAEADPTLDVEGFDTAHKLAILNALAYGMEINLDDIYVEGISKIDPVDIAFAREFGYKVKLLAIGKNNGGSVEARVHPTMIPFADPLSSVSGSLNAVSITADAVSRVMLYGRGAGMMPTGSAVVSDIVDIARNLITGTTGRIPIFSYQPEAIRKIPILPVDEIHTHYYFRFAALDRPGVLSKISGILGENGISIRSVHQKGRKSEGTVPIVMLTHRAREADVKKALGEITLLDIVSDQPVLIRIEDENGGD